jgi:hypothetical protein
MEKKKKRTIEFRVKRCRKRFKKEGKEKREEDENRRENQGYHAQGKARMGKDKGK